MNRWLVHVIGPDDIIYCKDELSALRMANDINLGVVGVEHKEHDPFVIAVAKKAGDE